MEAGSEKRLPPLMNSRTSRKGPGGRLRTRGSAPLARLKWLRKAIESPQFLKAESGIRYNREYMCRIAALCHLACSFLSAQKFSFDAEALMKVARIGDPQLSPDGRT